MEVKREGRCFTMLLFILFEPCECIILIKNYLVYFQLFLKGKTKPICRGKKKKEEKHIHPHRKREKVVVYLKP